MYIYNAYMFTSYLQSVAVGRVEATIGDLVSTDPTARFEDLLTNSTADLIQQLQRALRW